MSDREMVIKGLEQFKADFKPFCGNGSDWARVDNAIALLKKQEAVKPITETTNLKEWGAPDEKITAEAIKKWTFHLCGNCKATLLRTDNYCSKCGRKIKWDD